MSSMKFNGSGPSGFQNTLLHNNLIHVLFIQKFKFLSFYALHNARFQVVDPKYESLDAC